MHLRHLQVEPEDETESEARDWIDISSSWLRTFESNTMLPNLAFDSSFVPSQQSQISVVLPREGSAEPASLGGKNGGISEVRF